MCAIEFPTVISTPRLRLRGPRRTDAARIAEYCNDYDVAKMTTAIPYPYSLADAEGFLARATEQGSDFEAVFVIDHPKHGAIGVMGFDGAKSDEIEIGYWLGRPYWGEGYATEAAQGALVWARQTWGRRYLRAGHFADNPASGEVLRKAGFLYTGEVQQRPSRARGGIPAATRMMVWLA